MIPYVHVPDLRIGPLPIHPFGILVMMGVLIGTALTTRRARKLGYDIPLLNSFITWMLLLGFIGGHVIDMLLYDWRGFIEAPYRIFLIWESLGSFGGFTGALLGILCWKYFEAVNPTFEQWLRRPWALLRRRKQPLPILPYADLVLSVFPISWIFGRSGCATAHDHPGRVGTGPLTVTYPPDNIILLHSPTHYPVAEMCQDPGVSSAGPFALIHNIVPDCVVKATQPGGIDVQNALMTHGFPRLEAGQLAYHVDMTKLGPINLVHGTVSRYDLGLLELMFAVILSFFVVLTWRYKVKTGTYVVVTALSYAPVRFVLDFFRRDDGPNSETRYGALTPAQFYCIALFVFGLVMLFVVIRMKTDPAERLRAAPEEAPRPEGLEAQASSS